MTVAPMEFFQGEKQRIMQRLFPQQQAPEQQGGEAYGGDLAGREADRMRSGGAPFTAKGIGTALGNAFTAVTGAVSPMGLAGMGMQATGLDQKTVFGEKLGSLFGGGFQNVPGHFAYDKDLMDAVRQGQMTRATADNIQRERNMAKERDKLSRGLTAPGRSMANRGGFGPTRGGGDRSGGRGGMSGAMGGNTPSGRDKPGPGGKVR